MTEQSPITLAADPQPKGKTRMNRTNALIEGPWTIDQRERVRDYSVRSAASLLNAWRNEVKTDAHAKLEKHQLDHSRIGFTSTRYTITYQHWTTADSFQTLVIRRDSPPELKGKAFRD